jgi:hypothetical protein
VSAVLADAVGRMLLGFSSRVDPERIDVFVAAVEDERLCGTCAAGAAARLGRSASRAPVPSDLISETRDAMREPSHADHLADQRALGGGDEELWWSTKAPVAVRRAWPELSGEQARTVAEAIRGIGSARPRDEDVAIELGYVDERGPTTERRWWLDSYPDLRESLTPAQRRAYESGDWLGPGREPEPREAP